MGKWHWSLLAITQGSRYKENRKGKQSIFSLGDGMSRLSCAEKIFIKFWKIRNIRTYPWNSCYNLIRSKNSVRVFFASEDVGKTMY